MEHEVTNWTAKILDYGVLGIAVLVCGYLVYRMARFIVTKFEESEEKCEESRVELIKRLDETQKRIETISGSLVIDMQKTAAAGNAAQERIADLGDRFMRFMEEETRQYVRREKHRGTDS